ncbi:transposase, partial [Paraburkholderia sp. BR14320]
MNASRTLRDDVFQRYFSNLLKGDKTLAELAQQYDVHPNQITDWKKQLQERVSEVFETGKS